MGPDYPALRPAAPAPGIGPVALPLEHERDQHVDLVARGLAVADLDALLLHPGRGDVAQRLARAGDAHLDGVLEALVGPRADLRDARHRPRQGRLLSRGLRTVVALCH